jgi:hypothetical protein
MKIIKIEHRRLGMEHKHYFGEHSQWQHMLIVKQKICCALLPTQKFLQHSNYLRQKVIIWDLRFLSRFSIMLTASPFWTGNS